jgi:aldehyde dehydrogenase (NAD+)
MKTRIQEFYQGNAAASASYMRIVNARNFDRVMSNLNDSVNAGARIVTGGKSDRQNNFIEPTIVIDVPLQSPLMQEEIFGPVLPVIPYRDLQDAIDLIRTKENPLALYIYSRSKRNVNRILIMTRAGGTCINNSGVHFFNPNLPFGGTNNSGIGKAHGKFGFISFSNERGVFRQVLPSALDWLLPPYTTSKQKLIDLIIRWF